MGGKAYDFMFTLLKGKEITKDHVLTMHKLFYHDIKENYAGKYRHMNGIITGSNYPVTDYTNINYEMDNLFNWINSERQNYHPVVFAALLYKKFNSSILPKMETEG